MFAQNDDVRKLSVRRHRRAKSERPAERPHGTSAERFPGPRRPSLSVNYAVEGASAHHAESASTRGSRASELSPAEGSRSGRGTNLRVRFSADVRDSQTDAPSCANRQRVWRGLLGTASVIPESLLSEPTLEIGVARMVFPILARSGVPT